MKRFTLNLLLAASVFAIPVLAGCDKTVSEESKVEKKADGTVVTDTAKTVQSSDGGIKTTTERKVDPKPDAATVTDKEKTTQTPDGGTKTTSEHTVTK